LEASRVLQADIPKGIVVQQVGRTKIQGQLIERTRVKATMMMMDYRILL